MTFGNTIRRVIVVLTVINVMVLIGMIIVGDEPKSTGDTVSLSKILKSYHLMAPSYFICSCTIQRRKIVWVYER